MDYFLNSGNGEDASASSICLLGMLRENGLTDPWALSLTITILQHAVFKG